MAGIATLAQVRALQDKVQKTESALQRANNMRKNIVKQVEAKLENVTDTAVQSVEVGGTAFVFGLGAGKFGGAEIAGIPIDLTAGFVLHAAGLVMDEPEAAKHLHNIGDGCLASWAHTVGLGIGRRWAEDSPAAAVART